MKALRKATLGVLLLAGLVATTVGFAPAAQAKTVFCQVPGNYKVTCYNYSPYRVFMRVNVFTTAGLRVRYFTIKYTKYTFYSSAPIDRITWHWHY